MNILQKSGLTEFVILNEVKNLLFIIHLINRKTLLPNCRDQGDTYLRLLQKPHYVTHILS